MTRHAIAVSAVVLGLFASAFVGGAVPATAGVRPDATKLPTTCVDGLGEGHVNLAAADGSNTTFTTVVNDFSGEVFRDDDRQVSAGQSETVVIPDLFYGGYSLRVLVDGAQILGDDLDVRCVPTKPYTNPSLGGGYGCENDVTYVVSNSPIKGAEELLRAAHFVIAAHSEHGVKVLLDTTLPDGDSDPYNESTTVYPGDHAKGANIVVTADGEPVPTGPFAIPSCAIPPQPPLPETGG